MDDAAIHLPTEGAELDTLVDLFSQTAREHGQRECVWIERTDGIDAWSYQELWRRANAAAYQLHRGGVGPGERVLVYAPNSPRLVATYFGLLLLGSVIVPIDMRSSPEFMVAVREKARAHTLISAGEPPAELASVHALSVESLTEDVASDPGDWRPVSPGPDDLAEIVFTSGTTGRPKGVMLTHRNIASNAESAASVLSDLANFRALSLIPLSHMFEQIALFAGMLLGASFTYVETLAPNTLFDTLRRRRVTMIPTVPQILQIFYRAIEAEVRRQGRTRIWNVAHTLARRSPMPVRRRLFSQVHQRLGGHLEYFFCGGAYLPPELQEAWERLGVKVLQGYGTTECSPVVTANNPDRRVVGSVGRPIPGVEIKLSEEGEILVRGDNVTAGYFEDPDATSAAFDDGWYKTKDLGELDKDANLYIRGRKDDMIVLPDGQNLYPEDLENALRGQAAVRDAVVFGLQRSRGLQIHAVLVPEPHESGIDVTGEELVEAVKAANRSLANFQRIDSHEVWAGEDFPRTHTLKVKRAEVLKSISG